MIQKEIDLLDDESLLFNKPKPNTTDLNASLHKSKTGRTDDFFKKVDPNYSLNKQNKSGKRSKSQRITNDDLIKELKNEIMIKDIDTYLCKNKQNIKRISIQKYHHIFEDGIITFNSNRLNHVSSMKNKRRYSQR